MSPRKKITDDAKKSASIRKDENSVEQETCRRGKRVKKVIAPSNETPEVRPIRKQNKSKRETDNIEKASSSGVSRSQEQKIIQETAIQITLRRLAAQNRQRASRMNESAEHRKIRLAKDRERQRQARMKLTPEQKMARLQADRERKVVMRANESDSEKQRRLKFDRERHIISRLNKSIAETAIPIEYLTADVTITESEVEFRAPKIEEVEEPDSTQSIECPQKWIAVPEEDPSHSDDDNLPTSTNRANT